MNYSVLTNAVMNAFQPLIPVLLSVFGAISLLLIALVGGNAVLVAFGWRLDRQSRQELRDEAALLGRRDEYFKGLDEAALKRQWRDEWREERGRF